MITKPVQEYLTLRRDILAEAELVRDEVAAKVRELVTAGESVGELAKLTGLTRARIYQIRNGK